MLWTLPATLGLLRFLLSVHLYIQVYSYRCHGGHSQHPLYNFFGDDGRSGIHILQAAGRTYNTGRQAYRRCKTDGLYRYISGGTGLTSEAGLSPVMPP